MHTPELLDLATQLIRYPYNPGMGIEAQARSRTCGSQVMMTLAVDDRRCINSIGMKVNACAVGQAACAIFAADARGHDLGAIRRTHDQLVAWLNGRAAIPDWQQIELLCPVVAHPGRHGAVLLPWQAACEALELQAAC